jgi:hypothetical protein
MRRRLAFALILTLATSARAVTLDDVKRNLSELRGAVPLTIKLASVDQRSDDKENTESRGTSVAEDDGTYIRLVHEKKGLTRRDEKKRGADHSVGAAEAAELLNFAPSLLSMMEGATLRKTTPTTHGGKPATLLELTLPRVKDEDGDKWIRKYVDTLLLWVDGAGTPLAAQRIRELKARVVVIGFELKDKDDLTFVRAGDRLVIAKRVTTSSGSGLGQSERSTKTVSATIVAKAA